MVVSQAQKGRNYFTELAERAEYGNCDIHINLDRTGFLDGGLLSVGSPSAPTEARIGGLCTVIRIALYVYSIVIQLMA